ncbi:MAG: SDR family NAD(P)-dependent oxidoreductase [Alphaproteobacteria bacterium]|nr:SDR family NAD(P)-dependent oxidoreductase [Alphaproteobacteria bacterium]
MDVKGVAALVTGGASGLGFATAKALAAAGAKVTILDVNEAAAAKAAAELGGLGLACDVASADGAAKAVAAAKAKHGAARVLINCAGVGTPAKAVGKDGALALEVFAKVVNINLIGTFNLIRLFAADLQKEEPLAGKERGVIVNTASVAAFDGQIGQPAYAASKGGVVAMTLPLAREFASHGIRVCTIAPGLFLTPMMKVLPEQAQQSLAAQVPFPSRLGDPSEYAGLAMHIVQNQMLNGETIRLDGSIRMTPR